LLPGGEHAFKGEDAMLSREYVKTICARGVLAGVLGFLVLMAIGVTEIQRNQINTAQPAKQMTGR